MPDKIKLYPETDVEAIIADRLFDARAESLLKLLPGQPEYALPINLMPVEQRLLVSDALVKIVHDLFDWINEFNPEPQVCHEYGCGATAFFYQHLVPETLKPKWKQFDLLPNHVDYARQHNPEACIEQGDITAITAADNSLDLVVCYSSLDSIINLEEAVQEVYKKLKPGGLLVAFQDIAPSMSVVLREHRKKIEERNYAIQNRRLKDVPSANVRYCIGEDEHVVEWLEVNGKQVDSNTYHHDDLVHTAREAGFNILYESNDVHREALTDRKPVHNTSENKGSNIFYFKSGEVREGKVPDVPDGKVYQIASLGVLVARKEN